MGQDHCLRAHLKLSIYPRDLEEQLIRSPIIRFAGWDLIIHKFPEHMDAAHLGTSVDEMLLKCSLFVVFLFVVCFHLQYSLETEQLGLFLVLCLLN